MAVIERIKYKDVDGIRVGKFTSRINTTCTVYRLGNVVVDAGPPNQWAWVRAFLQETKVREVLITHHHEDHGGNAAAIQKAMHIPVKVHASAKPYFERGFHMQLYRQVIWGKPETTRPEVISTAMELENGLAIEPIHCPGHSTDMTCFFIPQRGWLFTGDLYIASKPKYLRKDENPRQEIESLQKILQYDFETVFCAHRGVIESGHEALQDKLDFLLNLQEEIARRYQMGKSVKEITAELLGREDLLSWLTFFHFSKRNLVMALLPERQDAPGE